MKLFKLSALVATAVLSNVAMAGVISDVGDTIADAGSTIVDGGKTVFTTLSKPGAVNVEIGTLGYGASIAWSANESTEVVAGWNGAKFDINADIGGNDSIINWNKVLGDEWGDYTGRLNLDVDLSNPYVGVNLRPWKNQFTVGTGMIFQDNNFTATLTSDELAKITVDGKEYQVKGDVSVRAKSGNALAPYLTIGVKPNTNSLNRLGFFGEVGAAYTGKYKTQVEVATDAQITGGTVEELERDLRGKINDNNISWYPIFKVGATYRF